MAALEGGVLERTVRAGACLALMLMGAAGSAWAAAGPEVVFVSPMGEPFRGPATQPYPSAAWFAAADADHDGMISRSEFRADAQRFFKLLDYDKDGKINDLEIQRYEYILAPEIVQATSDTSSYSLQRSDDDNAFKHTGFAAIRQGAANFSFLNEPEPVRAADIDFNHRVSADEWQAAADRRFARLADGKDGLKLAEMPRPPNQKPPPK
jgi:hypothetical protein